MEEKNHEQIVLTERKSRYEEPWIVEFVVEERNKKRTFEEIANDLKERGETSITPQIVSSLHKKAIARTITTVTEAKGDFIDFTEQLKEIYGDVITLMGNYVKSLRNINDEIGKAVVTDENGTVNLLATQMAVAKQIPLAVGLMKEVREYVKNQISLYDIVQETKEKDIVWSESKMLAYYNTFEPIRLKQLEEEGDIKILNRNILKSN